MTERRNEQPQVGNNCHMAPYGEIISDFLCFFFGFTGGYGLYVLFMQHPLPGGLAAYAQLGFFFAITGTLTFYITGLYQHQASIMNLLETRKLFRLVCMLYLVLIVYSFFTKSPYSRVTFCLSFILILVFLNISKFLVFKRNQNRYIHGKGVQNILIIGAGPTGRLLFQSLSHTPKLGYYPVGFFEPETINHEDIKGLHPLSPQQDVLLLTDLDQCLDYITTHTIHRIIITQPLFKNERSELQQLIGVCRKQKVQLQTIPYLLSLFGEQVQLLDVNGIPLISFHDIQVSPGEQIIKRCFDLVVALLLCLVLLPVMLVIALLIKLDSKGPVLFKQQRVGQLGKPFIMYKFRTMFTDTPIFTSSPSAPDDSRITRLGKILRKTSLDELPQIFNVLEGTMSLVGPRPEMEFLTQSANNELYRQRLRVKPGVTGIWQISADRKRQIHEDISYDLFYIAHRSLLLDILILLRTIPALFFMQTY